MSASSLIEAISGHIRSLNYLQARENVDALGLLCNESSSSPKNFTKYLICDIFLKMAIPEGQSTRFPKVDGSSRVSECGRNDDLFADDERSGSVAYQRSIGTRDERL